MLENTVWRHYNSDNSFRAKIAEFCFLEPLDLIEDDKELYGALKAKLTKKELKLFAMNSGEVSNEEIKKEFEVNDEELEKLNFKLYKKLKQDKTRFALKATSFEFE